MIRREKASAPNALPAVPDILKKIPNWVAWKLVDGDKPPFIVGTNFEKLASSTDSSTWTDFSTAVMKTTINSVEGVGFVIGGAAIEKEIVGVDIDGCRNPETGELTPWADKLVDLLNSYAEVTPSKTGVRVWVIGKWPFKEHVFNLNPAVGVGDKVKIEVYSQGRYFTVTGDSLYEDEAAIENRDLTEAYNLCLQIQAQNPPPSKSKTESTGSATVEGAKIDREGSTITTKLELLMTGTVQSGKPTIITDGLGNSLEYPSHSEADMALCTALALKHGDDVDLIWTDYLKSPLCRDRWVNREEYFKEHTIANAIVTAQKIKESQKAVEPKAAEPASTQPTASEIQPFVSVDGDMFMQENIPPRKTLIRLVDRKYPIFTEQSINQIFAWRGLGKTCMGFGLTAAFANGGSFLNWEASQRTRVLYVEGELPAAQAQERWRQIIGTTNGYARLITIDKQPGHTIPSLATAIGMARIEKTLADLERQGFKVEVLILDSISTLFNIATNDEEGWLTIQAWLISLRSRGLCIFFFHHAGKSGLSRSHSKSEDMLDISIKLDFPKEPDPDCLHVVMHYDKARAGFSEPDTEVKMHRAHGENCLCRTKPTLIGCTGDSVRWERKIPGDSRRFEAEQRFRAGMSDRDIAEELDIIPSTVRNWRKKWKDKADKLAGI